MERIQSNLRFLRFFIVGSIFALGVLLLIYMFLDAKAYGLGGSPPQDNTVSVSNNGLVEWHARSNVITRSTLQMTNDFEAIALAAGRGTLAIGNTLGSVATRSVRYIARTSYAGLSFVAQNIAGGITYTARSMGKFFGYISSSTVVSAMIKPSTTTEVPLIDPEIANSFTKLNAVGIPAASEQTYPKEATWPIHGRITTQFGVPHWPWQPTHTGLDISDGNPSGITPAKPYRPGRVIETIQSSSGLGNHVIIDHGHGITSVYAHLDSIAVTPGQDVDASTTLGLTGTTGASIGTHLHFEIRENGQQVNPNKYISGQP